MIPFFSKKITREQNIDVGHLKSELRNSFEVNQKVHSLELIRNRAIGNRGILKIFLPKMITKLSIEENVLKYQIKLDGLAFFILFMGIGALIVEFTTDRVQFPREYPIYLPLGLVVWYLFSIVIEAFRVNDTLKSNLTTK